MYLTGFADEAATALEGQIKATLELGWRHIEARAIDGVNIHDLSDAAFDRAYGLLTEAGISVNCFGSAIMNWGKDVRKVGDFERDLEQTRRAIPRMKRLGTRLVRVMSYAVIHGAPAWDQLAAERFRRMREICGMFLDAGLQPVHENCMNYGGMGASFTLRMLDNVHGLKLVFDTGNPIFSTDYDSPDDEMQSAWEFYRQVRQHIAYVHVKDAVFNPKANKTEYTMPGKGLGSVARIVRDLVSTGYDGGISIEPHIGAVFHDPSVTTDDEKKYRMYVEYGRQMEALLRTP